MSRFQSEKRNPKRVHQGETPNQREKAIKAALKNGAKFSKDFIETAVQEAKVQNNSKKDIKWSIGRRSAKEFLEPLRSLQHSFLLNACMRGINAVPHHHIPAVEYIPGSLISQMASKVSYPIQASAVANFLSRQDFPSLFSSEPIMPEHLSVVSDKAQNTTTVYLNLPATEQLQKEHDWVHRELVSPFLSEEDDSKPSEFSLAIGRLHTLNSYHIDGIVEATRQSLPAEVLLGKLTTFATVLDPQHWKNIGFTAG